MKLQFLSILAISIAAISSPLPAQNLVPAPTTTDADPNVSPPPCANESNTEGCSGGGCGESDNNTSGMPSPCDVGSSPVNAYNGNGQRKITDLAISGSVGNKPLRFERISNTRLSGRNLLAKASFGKESPWSHNYDWLMRDSGGTPSRPIITITYPDGKERTFWYKTGSTTEWVTTTPLRNSDRILTSGDDFVLHTFGLDRFHFKRRFHTVTGAVFYRIEAITDSESNTYSIGYDNADDTSIRQITDAAGHFIKLHYRDEAIQASNPTKLNTAAIPFDNNGTPPWREIAVTPGDTFRILAFYQGNEADWTSPPRIREIEFYDENNVKISGSPIGSSPWVGANSPDRAFDGNIATFYQYPYRKAGFVGIDLGAGNGKKVSRIRYQFTGSSNANMRFVGINNDLIPTQVISHVEGSDGRIIDYDYAVHNDPGGLFQWVTLAGATYPDATAATYTYKTLHEFVMPVIDTMDDPRLSSAAKNIRYGYINNTIIGFVTDQFDSASGNLLVKVRWDGNHTPKLVYPNAKVELHQYKGGNLMRSVDSYGAYTDYTYSDGWITKAIDPLDRTTTYGRRADRRLISITTPAGSVTTYTRDTPGYITAVNENGKTTSYVLDPATRLRTRTNHPDGTYETWTYNTYGQELTHRLRNGSTESWTYDAAGLRKSHTDAIGAVTQYHHFGDPGYPASNAHPTAVNVAGRLAAMVDAHGNTTTYSYNDRGQVTKEIRTPGGNITFAGQTVQDTSNDFTVTTDNTYDDYGNLIARAVNTSDPDAAARVWLYEYDSLSRRIREEDPLGRVSLTRYGTDTGGCGPCGVSNAKPFETEAPDGTITRYTYDKEWRLLTSTRAFGTPQAATTTYTYDYAGQRLTMEDPLGHITRWTYDADGRVTSETRAHGTPIASTTGYTYDASGNRLTVTDPVGAVTRTTYDVMDRPLTQTRAWNTPIALTTTYTYALGRLASARDNINRTVAFTHDALDRTIRTDMPDGNYTESFFDLLGRNYANRDILGNFPASVFNSRGQTLASTDAAGVTTTAFYNGHGDLTATSLPSGKSVAYQHDNLGNVIITTLAPDTPEETVVSEILTRDAMLRPLTVKDGEGTVTTTTYDPLGRTLTTKDALNNITTYTYDLDGQLLTTRAADNVITSTRTYDALHRLKTEKDGKNQTITYNYDAAGRMTSYIDAKGATFSFQFDLLGRQARRTEPDATFQAWTYDSAGRMEYHTKADGIVIRHHYENPARDELTRTTYNGGTPDRNYTYTGFGQLHIASNAHSTVTYGYDAAGRKTSETQALPGLPGTHTFAYFYDGDGNLDYHRRPDMSIVDYAYNLRNLLKDITADTAPPVAEYTYNGRNQLHETEVENGLFTATRAYDNAGRLTEVGTVSPSSPTLDSTGYTLSPDGRRTGVTRNGQSETYGYDNARQVESASIPLTGGTHTDGYQYDAAANRSSATTNGVTTSYLANAVNEYTSWSGGSLPPSHDANGNQLTTYAGATLTWNIHNEMVTATAANGDSAQYQYDALGRRTKRTETIGGVTTSTWFLTNGWNVELEYENGAYARRLSWGQDLSQTLQGAGGVGGLVMSEELPPGGGAPVPHFPTYDGNGNITAWVNASGTVTARQRYDAFGNIIEQTGTPPSRYGFSTKPIELVTGFLYYGYRYYDAVIGRWPSRDPIGERGGINLYGFVGNDGKNDRDYLGLKWQIGNIGSDPSTLRHGVGDWERHWTDYTVHANLLAQVLHGTHLFRLAGELGTHYMSNDGSDFSINGYYHELFAKLPSWEKLVASIVKEGAKYADANADYEPKNIFYNAIDSTRGWNITDSAEAFSLGIGLGQFWFGVEGIMSCENNKIGYLYNIRIHDIYDFDNTDQWATINSRDAAWHRMQRVGLAKHFKVVGQYARFFTWEKGRIPHSFDP